MRRSIPTTQRSFTATRSSTADAHTLALIASSLVAATAIAFLAMVLTAWPARAAEPVRVAAVNPALIAGIGQSLPQPRLDAPAAARPAAPVTRTALLGTLPMAAEPCPVSIDAIAAAVNDSLAEVEAAADADGAAQCQAFRVHMTLLQRAARTVERCIRGEARSAKLSLIRRSMTDWSGVIANGCP